MWISGKSADLLSDQVGAMPMLDEIQSIPVTDELTSRLVYAAGKFSAPNPYATWYFDTRCVYLIS